MTGNVDFPDPNPPLEELDAKLTALTIASENAEDGGSDRTAIMRSKEKELDVVLVKLAYYVQNKSEGDKVKIESAGYEVRSTTTTPGKIPEQPQKLKAIISTYVGEVLLKWKSTENAKSYFVEKSMDGISNWATCGMCTKSNIAIGGLPSTVIIWFRVTAVGPAGVSPVSAVIKALAA